MVFHMTDNAEVPLGSAVGRAKNRDDEGTSRDGSQYRQNTYQKSCLKITFTACVLVVFWKGRIDMCSRKGSVYLKIS